MSATDGTNVSATIPTTALDLPESDATPVAIADLVPKQYADAQWVKEVPDVDTLFKMVDDQKAALSRRRVPEPGSAEWGDFAKELGVPETADAYSFDREGVEFTDTQKALQEGLRPVLHKAQVTPWQLGVLAPAFDEVTEQLAQAQQAEADKVFDELSASVFSDDASKDKAFAQTREFWKKYVPESALGASSGLDNKALLGLSVIVQGIVKDYIAEDRIPAGGGPPTQATSEQDIRAEASKLMADPAYSDPFHAQHDAIRKQVEGLYKRLTPG